MTIKRLSTLLSTLLVLIGFTVQAQTKDTPSVSTAQNALLWEITGKGLTKPSYIYGTIHLIPKSDFFLTDATKKALNESQKVMFEINMKDMQNPMLILSIMSKAIMPRGQKLRDLISKEDYALVKARFEEIGMPLPMLESIKPMFLSAMVEGGGSPMDTSGKEATTAYEMEIMKIADKDKKEMGGLETMEFQMGIFDSIPLKTQAEMLVKSIKSVNNGESEFKAMVELYKSQDIEAMAGTMKGGEENELSKYEGILLTSRNKNWIPLIAKNSAGKSTFYAVGAGHLGGEMGVVNLLRQEGFTLKPLK
ncbi:MAG: TraB/GumN family protein [Saprospiraceae bacterium]|nr:TraB/GumN family protein [Saprospiraceae bacterium]